MRLGGIAGDFTRAGDRADTLATEGMAATQLTILLLCHPFRAASDELDSSVGLR